MPGFLLANVPFGLARTYYASVKDFWELAQPLWEWENQRADVVVDEVAALLRLLTVAFGTDLPLRYVCSGPLSRNKRYSVRVLASGTPRDIGAHNR